MLRVDRRSLEGGANPTSTSSPPVAATTTAISTSAPAAGITTARPLSPLEVPPSPGALAAVPTDGEAYFEAILLPQIRALVKQGRPCALVFDIDNTLVDTRYRTLAAAQAFGRAHESAALEHCRLEDVGVDGRDTARRLGITSPDLVEAFQADWLERFWDPKSFELDRRIDRTARLAERAKAAGAEVFYLTGRIEALRSATREQLEHHRLPDADDAHIIMKPRIGVPTAAFKADALTHGLRLGTKARAGARARANLKIRVVGFISEGKRDISVIQSRTHVPALLYDFPIDREGFETRLGTPVIPA